MGGVILLLVFVAFLAFDGVALYLDVRHRDDGGLSAYRPLVKRVFVVMAAAVYMVLSLMGLTMPGAVVIVLAFVFTSAFIEALPGERWRRPFWRGLFLYTLSYAVLAALFFLAAWLFFIVFTLRGLFVALLFGLLTASASIYVFGPRILSRHMSLVPYEHRIDTGRLPFDTDLLDDVRMVRTSGGIFTMNAVLLAFFGKKKLIVSPEILANLTSDGVAAIMVHEIAHDKKRHLQRRLLFVASAFILYVAFGRILAKSGIFGAGAEMWGAMVFGLATLTMLLRIPFLHLLHRQEFEADAFVARAGYGKALQEALHSIERHGPSTDRHPLYAQLFLTHPPTKRRIEALQASEQEPQQAPVSPNPRE